jgi:TATA-binding protein-associated factor
VADILESSGRPYFLMDGSVNTKERAKIVEKFSKEDKPWVLLLNYKIGSEGLNLQACNNAVFTDLCWNASGMKQAARRFWRIGQEKEVHCYYLLVENSIESRMMEICEDKADAMKKYLDGEDTKLDKNVVGRIIGRRGTNSGVIENVQLHRDCRDEVISVA